MRVARLLHETGSNLCVATCVILSCVLVTGCRAKRIVTVEQANEMIRNHVHVGSSKAEVMAFVDSLRIDSLRIAHEDRFFGPELLGGFDHEKTDPLGDRLKEFYDVSIMDVAPSTETFMVSIFIRFYFDADGKLLDYTIKEDTSFR